MVSYRYQIALANPNASLKSRVQVNLVSQAASVGFIPKKTGKEGFCMYTDFFNMMLKLSRCGQIKAVCERKPGLWVF